MERYIKIVDAYKRNPFFPFIIYSIYNRVRKCFTRYTIYIQKRKSQKNRLITYIIKSFHSKYT